MDGPDARPSSGLCGLPGVTSPTLLRQYWAAGIRPRLDRLLRKAASEPPGPSYLASLDWLLAELREAQAVCRHSATRHAEVAWRQAAAEVAAECGKYERFVLQGGGGGGLRKLVATRRRLEHAAQQPPSQAADAGPGTPGTSSTSGPPSSTPQLLRLCDQLAATLQRGGAGVEDGTSHLVAVLGAPNEGQDRLSRLMAAERQAAAAVQDAATGRGAGPPPVLMPQDLATLLADDPTNSRHDKDLDGVQDNGSAFEALGRRVVELAAQSDPWVDAMLRAAHAAGLPPGVLPLTPHNLQELLRSHPSRQLRRAVYMRGLLPRHAHALRAVGRVAQLRAHIAALHDAESFATYSLSSMALPDAGAVGAFLLRLLTALRPAADAEVREMQHALAALETAGGSQASACNSGKESSRCGISAMDGGAAAAAVAAHTAADPQHASTGDSSVLPPSLEPWDMDVAAAAALRSRGLPPPAEQLQPYLHLGPLLRGLDELLQGSMGLSLEQQDLAPGEAWAPGVVKLLLQAKGVDGANTGSSGGTQQMAGAAAPGAGQRLLAAVDGTAKLVGVIYLDPGGGGYGTRQLRFTCDGMLASAGSQEARLPSVSIGLQWSWAGGQAGGLAAIHELLHELGHALHLLLSSRAAPYKHLGGLHLPLDLLEAPSSFMQALAYSPGALRSLLRPAAEHGGDGGRDACADGRMSEEVACRLAAYFAAQHCSALGLQRMALACLLDLLLHHAPADGGAGQPPVEDAWHAVLEEHSSLPHCPTTLKQLSMLPVMAHHQATFHCYLVALATACALHSRHPLAGPCGEAAAAAPVSAEERPSQADGSHSCDHGGTAPAAQPGAWMPVRKLLFEATADVDPSALLRQLMAAVVPLADNSDGASCDLVAHGPQVVGSDVEADSPLNGLANFRQLSGTLAHTLMSVLD